MQSQGLAGVGGQAGSSAVRFTRHENWRSQQPGTARKRTGNTRGFAEIRRVPHADEVFSRARRPHSLHKQKLPQACFAELRTRAGIRCLLRCGGPELGTT